MAKRKYSRPQRGRRKNPVQIEQVTGGMGVNEIGAATIAITGFKALQRVLKEKFEIDITKFGKLAEGLIKLGVGLGGIFAAEKAGLIEEDSDMAKTLKLAAVFMSIQDISESVVDLGFDFVSGSDSALALKNNESLGYATDPYGNKMPQPEAYGNPQALGYASDQFGDKISYNAYQNALRSGSLRGGFYSGNANLPRGTASQPDFLNQVVGRSDLSAIPDHMR